MDTLHKGDDDDDDDDDDVIMTVMTNILSWGICTQKC
jgi:hypothetical protein